MINRFSLLLFVLFMMLVSLVGCNENNDEQLLNSNQTTNQNIENNNQSAQIMPKTVRIEGKKQIGDIEITNIEIILEESNKCKVTADVKNTSDKDLAPTNVEIKVISEQGETEEIFGGIITELIWYETNTFTTYVLADITDAKDLEFRIIENEN